MKNAPIGIFDSGVGGLTVFREISRAFPSEDIIYFGDTARLPYGSKSTKTITRFVFENIRFLKKFGVKVIVCACNSASSALLYTKRNFVVPIINVIEPGVKEALSYSRNERIGVIGTETTIKSKAYNKVFRRYDCSHKTFFQACPLFVPLIEEDWVEKPESKIIVQRYLSKFKNKKIDTLILGCTHYPLLKSVIKNEIGRDVKLVDSSRAVAKELKILFEKEKITAKKRGCPQYKFFVSDLSPNFRKIAERFLGKKIGAINVQNV